MFHYIYSVHRKPNTDTSDYQGLGTPDPHPTGHSLFKLGFAARSADWIRLAAIQMLAAESLNDGFWLLTAYLTGTIK